MVDLTRIRADFPTFREFTYLDVAARCPLCSRVRAAIEAFLDDAQRGAYTKPRWFEKVEEVRGKVARLVGANVDEIAFVKNTSEGINAIATSLPWREGDNVVLCPELEHPNNVYAWLNLRRRGVDVKILPLAGAVLTPQEVAAAVDGRTRAVAVSAVSFTTGGRMDLEALSALCRERGFFLFVDAVQSLGIMATDVRRTPVDAMAAATSKGLLGLYGLGVLYCRRDQAEVLAPTYLARFGVQVEGEEHVQGAELVLARGARRFELGNYNFLAIHALDAALDVLLEVGVEVIEEHVLRLARQTAEGLLSLGYEVVSPVDERGRSHVVVFHGPGGRPSNEEISGRLDANKIRHSVRRNGVRVSFHVYNQEQDVRKLLSALAELRR